MRRSFRDRKLTNSWRDFGIIWAYVVVNIFASIGLYWVFRVPKNVGKEQVTPEESTEKRSDSHSEK
jgi:hypothetical protein